MDVKFSAGVWWLVAMAANVGNAPLSHESVSARVERQFFVCMALSASICAHDFCYIYICMCACVLLLLIHFAHFECELRWKPLNEFLGLYMCALLSPVHAPARAKYHSMVYQQHQKQYNNCSRWRSATQLPRAGVWVVWCHKRLLLSHVSGGVKKNAR